MGIQNLNLKYFKSVLLVFHAVLFTKKGLNKKKMILGDKKVERSSREANGVQHSVHTRVHLPAQHLICQNISKM